jgi:5-(carboxyamino)imidazole ribonucleotide synthase
VDVLLAPAQEPAATLEAAKQLALRVADAFNSPGVFAVELFLTHEGELLVNETAPRAHNSGHFTIEACSSSQYDQLLRVYLGLPLGETALRSPAAMVNLIGEGGTGPTSLKGLTQAMGVPDAFIHLYGKQETRTGRKMGHVTVLGRDTNELRQRIDTIKEHLHVVPASVAHHSTH